MHFTDTHAQLETHPEYLPGATPEIQMMGGYARLKTAIERERAHCEGACFLLDGGDEFQGSGPAAWSEGEVILAPLKALGIDVFTPGNWEPAYGPERFKQTMARLDCPVVCYNFHDTATGSRLFPASVTLKRQGVKISGRRRDRYRSEQTTTARGIPRHGHKRALKACAILSKNCAAACSRMWCRAHPYRVSIAREIARANARI